ncbi:MAG: hypothetical protein U0T32_13365 [Chitinophagales bacterium]
MSYAESTNTLSSTDPCGTLTTTIPSVRVYAVTGTTDINMNSATFASTGLTLTFTPNKPNALVSFTMSGRTDPSATPHTNVYARILLDGVSIGGTSAPGQDLDNGSVVTTWNLSFSKPVTVTTGVSHTLTLEWRRSGNVDGRIYCEPAGIPDSRHRTISVIEY